MGFRSSLIATTSSAFALEGLYGAVCYTTAQGTARSRWRLVVEVLDALFNLDSVPDVSARVERMFDVRDQGVHAWEAIRVPTKHGDIADMGVQYEVALFSHAEATASIDLLVELLVACVGQPRNRRAQRWSEQNRDAVDRFAIARQYGDLSGL
jgi:hypothetical protein